ncbi:MAG: DUF1761 domain-containing protein [Candidatus Nanopelagicales bacterium]
MDLTVFVPWFGVWLAVIVAFFANYLYFGPKTMFPVWWRAMGKPADEKPGQGQNMPLVFLLMVVALFVQAITLSWVLQATLKLYDLKDISLLTGALVGLGMGVAFAAMTSFGHRMFAGQGFKVWLIEIGGDLLGLVLMGAVLSIYV